MQCVEGGEQAGRVGVPPSTGSWSVNDCARSSPAAVRSRRLRTSSKKRCRQASTPLTPGFLASRAPLCPTGADELSPADHQLPAGDRLRDPQLDRPLPPFLVKVVVQGAALVLRPGPADAERLRRAVELLGVLADHMRPQPAPARDPGIVDVDRHPVSVRGAGGLPGWYNRAVEQLRIGETLGTYRLVEVLGAGAMGTVYLAEPASGGERVALKVLSPDVAGDEAFRRRFVREAGYARSVEHPGIVRVLDAGESRGLPFIAMEYVDGVDLATLLGSERRLDPRRAVGLLTQVAEALDAVHAAGLIHRDVKPANCIVTGSPPRERVLLTDFGVSRNPVKDSVALTVAGDFVGTHLYTAPEQLFGDPDPRADLYSLGCVLYEALTGQPPFPFEDVAAVLEAHVDLAPPALTELRPDLPAELAAAIARALAKAPGDRFDSCTALIAAASEALMQWAGPADAAGPLTLVVTAGRAAGQEIELAGELVLGRGQDGSGALGTDIELSRRHARIAQGANGFFVEDLGSTNGTLRNGHAIDGPEPLRDGDELELGSTRLAVRRRSARPRRLTLRIELDPVTRRVGIEIDDGTLLELDEGRWSLRAGSAREVSE